MKKIGTLLIAAAVICQAFSQEKAPGAREEKNASRGLSMLETLEGTSVQYEKRVQNEKPSQDYYNDYNVLHRHQDYTEKTRRRRAGNFRGHWSGFEFGFNNYTYLRSMELPDDISYMSLITSKSNSFNFNISQLNMGITRRLGFVTGIGLNCNNYRFEGSNNITIGPGRVISELIPESGSAVKRSKFSTLYLNIPALLELQIPAGYSRSLNIAAGVIGGIKLNATTKIVYENKETVKANGDFNLNLFRGGFTARVGYENFMLYGTYYATPWFRELKGPNGRNPEPFEIGLAFTFNN